MGPGLALLFALALKNIIFHPKLMAEIPGMPDFSEISHSTNSGFSDKGSILCNRIGLTAMRSKVVRLKPP